MEEMTLTLRLLVSLAALSALLAGPSGESLELKRAREEAVRLKELVDAGAIPRVRLQQVEEQIADAQDDEILRRTLYGNLSVQDLTREQGEEMVAAAERRAARVQAKVEHARGMVESGVATRLSLTPLLQDLDDRRRTVDLAISRAKLLDELVEMALAEQNAAEEEYPAGPLPVAERFDGSGIFGDSHLKKVLLAYEREFSKPMPISARGMTALHRSLGFDHRRRVDVALNPDHSEGVWLREFLESAQIPYIAFRAAVPGKSTAPHIHIGPPSNRLRHAD